MNPLWHKFLFFKSSINWLTSLVYAILEQPMYITRREEFLVVGFQIKTLVFLWEFFISDPPMRKWNSSFLLLYFFVLLVFCECVCLFFLICTFVFIVLFVCFGFFLFVCFLICFYFWIRNSYCFLWLMRICR